MTLDFPAFARIVAASFRRLTTQNAPFITRVDGDALYEEYIKAFPAGTNPTFKVRTEHDCVCCKHFIRRVGNVVAINPDFHVSTIWDDAAKKAPHPYNLVAAALRDAVLSSPICGIFRVRSNEACFGAERTLSQDPLSQELRRWDHFFTGDIERALRVPSPGQVCGDYATTVAVFKRGLSEIHPSAIETVLDLIESNNLYRGEEHKAAILNFQKSQKGYLALKNEQTQNLFAWRHAADPSARFRGTVIGTLVQDLSSDVELDAAVRSFEAKVAPGNYKRTTTIITPMMIKQAMKTIEELGLEPALERRLAKIEDVSVSDVIWVSGNIRPKMKGGLADTLLAHAKRVTPIVADANNAIDITMDDFMANVLPTATGLELLFQNEHVGNLMALTAPVHAEPRQLFRWPNDFGWSYCGNVTDSIRERVKKAGGRVDGALLRVSLSWGNYDDLDLHVREPDVRGVRALNNHIYFANRRGGTGGTLDVDMNAGGRHSREPVENVVWSAAVPDGAYRIEVHNYNKRENTDVGFVVEVECGGKLTHFSYNKAMKQSQTLGVATLHMKSGAIERIDGGDSAISSAAIKQTKWELTTETFVKVNVVTLSPNFWGSNAVGNRHTFFVLDGCKADEELRGIYNEFLHPRLEGHRKVFEVIGDKTKCQPTGEHMAGIGFSSTKKDAFVIRVRSGKAQRTYNVKIG